MTHAEDQRFEAEWWGQCNLTWSEERKQIDYAKRMGLDLGYDGELYPVIDVNGKRIVDLGGGPVSMLLKCINLGAGSYVVDPLRYPDWTVARYAACDITVSHVPAENFVPTLGFDEAWIYNVLQHVINPPAVIEMAMKCAPIVRLFEWVNVEPHKGHPHMITEQDLGEWFGPNFHYNVEDGNSLAGVWRK